MPSSVQFRPSFGLSATFSVVAALIVAFAGGQTALGREQVVKVAGKTDKDTDEDTDKDLAGFGFGHWEGVEPLVTRLEPDNPRQKITKAETLAPEA
jgi:hypothetical protein